MTVVFTSIFLVIYKYAFNPQVVLTPNTNAMSTCPDRWTFNTVTKMCEPSYKTHCMPFNPTTPTLASVVGKCNVARSCGTTWSGFCG